MNAAFDWNTIYLMCFGVGLVLSVSPSSPASATSTSATFTSATAHLAGKTARHTAIGISPFNGFTLVAFLCWFGGTAICCTATVPSSLRSCSASRCSAASPARRWSSGSSTRVLLPMRRHLEPPTPR